MYRVFVHSTKLPEKYPYRSAARNGNTSAGQHSSNVWSNAPQSYFHQYANGHKEAAYLDKFPKRLDLPLCNPQSPDDHGWGIHIIEGENRVVLTWCCVVVLLASFVVSVVYSVLMETQEQGFGIGQWMIAVFTTMFAALYYQFEEN